MKRRLDRPGIARARSRGARDLRCLRDQSQVLSSRQCPRCNGYRSTNGHSYRDAPEAPDRTPAGPTPRGIRRSSCSTDRRWPCGHWPRSTSHLPLTSTGRSAHQASSVTMDRLSRREGMTSSSAAARAFHFSSSERKPRWTIPASARDVDDRLADQGQPQARPGLRAVAPEEVEELPAALVLVDAAHVEHIGPGQARSPPKAFRVQCARQRRSHAHDVAGHVLVRRRRSLSGPSPPRCCRRWPAACGRAAGRRTAGTRRPPRRWARAGPCPAPRPGRGTSGSTGRRRRRRGRGRRGGARCGARAAARTAPAPPASAARPPGRGRRGRRGPSSPRTHPGPAAASP